MTLPGLIAAKNLADIADQERAWDNLGSNISAAFPIPAPSLDLDFAGNKSLIDNVSGDELITFSRDSSATFIGSNGLVQTAASGVPRFDHNPATGESLGLLIEEARTNLALRSAELANWTNSGGAITITSNVEVAPDGTTTADRIAQSAVTGATRALYNTGTSVRSGQTFTTSFWMKRVSGTDTQPTIRFYGIGGGPSQLFTVTSDWIRYTWTWTAINDGGNYEIGSVVIGWDINGAANNNIYSIWGFQVEQASFATSYIPTSASTVTRAADVVSIAGANFSSWYRQDEGTLFVDAQIGSDLSLINACFISDATANNYIAFDTNTAGTTLAFAVNNLNAAQASILLGVPSSNTRARMIGGYQLNNFAAGINGGGITVDASGNVPTVSQLEIGQRLVTRAWNSTIARLVYYPVRLPDLALPFITSASGSPLSTTYPYTFTINGKDALALNGVSNASVRDFVFIKGLSSAAQPRLTTAAQQAASGTALQNAAMLKVSPTTSGNYFFSSGVTLSGVSTRINNTPARSIATSPFSGSTATASILLRELQPQANWRITEPMPSGVIASPEFAIPFETNDFVLFMKAGQN